MPTIVVIDDQVTTLKLLYKILNNISKLSNIRVHTFSDETKALLWLKNNSADLIMLDYKLSSLSGLEIILLIKQWPQYLNVPIVMITAYDEMSLRYAALDAGVSDFISKPIDYRECQARCFNLLQMRSYQQQLESHNHELAEQVKATTQTIINREREALFHLAKAGEYRDADTGNHIVRIASYSRLIAEGIGMDQEYCELIQHASPMHDVGKIGIPDHILLKPGRLNQNEWIIMRTHSEMGYEILQGSTSKYMQMGATIALRHHEKYNGEGYPNGLAGEAIPLEARIVAVADVFDALTSIRPYKIPWAIDKAIEYLRDEAGKHLDPKCVSALIAQHEKITTIHGKFTDEHTAHNHDRGKE
ncbi:MAG: response regulator [Gammaproteobacteria bacterium]|nr:response regulator [Gammaproteobacteria bacterium]